MDERRGRAKIRDNTANTLATIATNPNPTSYRGILGNLNSKGILYY